MQHRLCHFSIDDSFSLTSSSASLLHHQFSQQVSFCHSYNDHRTPCLYEDPFLHTSPHLYDGHHSCSFQMNTRSHQSNYSHCSQMTLSKSHHHRLEMSIHHSCAGPSDSCKCHRTYRSQTFLQVSQDGRIHQHRSSNRVAYHSLCPIGLRHRNHPRHSKSRSSHHRAHLRKGHLQTAPQTLLCAFFVPQPDAS